MTHLPYVTADTFGLDTEGATVVGRSASCAMDKQDKKYGRTWGHLNPESAFHTHWHAAS